MPSVNTGLAVLGYSACMFQCFLFQNLCFTTMLESTVKQVLIYFFLCVIYSTSGSVAECLACWTQAQNGLGLNCSRDAVDNSLRQTVHTHRASDHQAAKLVAALLRVAGVTAGLAESNGSLPLGL